MAIYTKLTNIAIKKAPNEEVAIEALRRLQGGRVLEILQALPLNLIPEALLLILNGIEKLNKEAHHAQA